MEVILLENIAKLGVLGDTVKVKSGYGRNYLIPQKKAVPATEENLKIFEERRMELEKVANARLAEAAERAEQIRALAVTLTANAGEEGKLFGSVTVRDIVDVVTAKGVALEKIEVRMPEGPIRQLGDYVIGVHLHPEVDAELQVSVVAEA